MAIELFYQTDCLLPYFSSGALLASTTYLIFFLPQESNNVVGKDSSF